MRLALLVFAAASFIAIGTGTASAISGTSGEGSAGMAQYPQASPNQPQLTLGEENQGDVLSGGPTSGDKEGAEAETVAGDVQPGRQAAADGGEGLHFTGLALIALLLAGTALLGGGLVLRRGSAPAA